MGQKYPDCCLQMYTLGGISQDNVFLILRRFLSLALTLGEVSSRQCMFDVMNIFIYSFIGGSKLKTMYV